MSDQKITFDNIQLVFDTLDPTEHNLATVFEACFGESMRYCHAWSQWFTWQQSHWREEKTQLAFDYCRQISARLNKTASKTVAKASFARGVESFARASRQFATEPSQWDKDYWLLNTPLSTYQLKTNESRPHQLTDYLTKCARVSPERGPHPIFDRFMRDICCEDEALIDYHKRSLGACLSGAIQDNFLLFWYGQGQNGKNTLGDLVEWMLGDYAKPIESSTLMSARHGDRHPTDLANLRGIRLAISSEVEEGSYFNEQRLKSLTGDARISARFMRQDYFEFTRTHKHLIYGNNRPLLRVVDPALKARLHIVPFKAHFPPDARDPQMAQKLLSEAPQILAWLIDGHEEWLHDGYLKKCSAVQTETENYFEAQSTPDMWVSECCETGDEEFWETAKDLYKSYEVWKKERGEGAMSQTRWGEWMGSRYIKGISSGRIRYRGIRFNQSNIPEKTVVGDTW